MNGFFLNRWVFIILVNFIGSCSEDHQIFGVSNAFSQSPAVIAKPSNSLTVITSKSEVHQSKVVSEILPLTSDIYVVVTRNGDIASFGFPFTPVFRKLDLLGVRFTYEGCGYYAGGPVPPGAVPPPDTPTAVHIKIAAADVPKVIAVGGVKPNAPNGAYTRSDGICTSLEERSRIPFRIAVWAAAVYPEYFPFLYPGAEGVFDGYEYFSFLGGNNLIGVKDGRVYVHNNTDWNFLDVGAVTDFIPAVPSGPVSAAQQGR